MPTLERDRFDELLGLLAADGFRLRGPSPRDGAIAVGTLESAANLPAGVGDEQAPGRYRTRPRTDGALFGHATATPGFRYECLPAETTLWRAVTDGSGGFRATEDIAGFAAPLALIGVRPCDLAALGVHDRALADVPIPDPSYVERRRRSFVVVAQCTQPAGTCFCASMGSGPTAREGFDIALTELVDGTRHLLVAEAGSPLGAIYLERAGARPSTEEERTTAAALCRDAAGRMGRTLRTEGLHDRLVGALEDSRWDEAGARCLACGNCTAVCPTCFCHTVEDVTPLDGRGAERRRRTDSCFTREFSHVHGGSVRAGRAARYRQWLTHKLATWIDQFGVSGCVGCGRCITWCPVGIDITEEAER